MTTSRQPWTTEQNAGSGKTWIKDADGRVIGVFDDWQDAELAVECVSEPGAVDHWREEAKFAMEECDILEKKLQDKDDEIQSLLETVSQLETQLGDGESHGKV